MNVANLSADELRLVEHFDCTNVVENVPTVLDLFRVMVEEAFLSGEASPYVDALRRSFYVLKYTPHIHQSKVYEALVEVA